MRYRGTQYGSINEVHRAIKKAVDDQKRWIAERGTNISGYLVHYGKETGQAIFDADQATLRIFEERLVEFESQHPEIAQERQRREEEHQRRLQEYKERAEKFAIEEAEVLSGIPEEFRDWFSYKAYERGHSAGFDEVLGCLRDSIDGFMDHLKKYDENRC